MLVICKVWQFYRQLCIVSSDVISWAVLLDYSIIVSDKKKKAVLWTTTIVNDVQN